MEQSGGDREVWTLIKLVRKDRNRDNGPDIHDWVSEEEEPVYADGQRRAVHREAGRVTRVQVRSGQNNRPRRFRTGGAVRGPGRREAKGGGCETEQEQEVRRGQRKRRNKNAEATSEMPRRC